MIIIILIIIFTMIIITIIIINIITIIIINIITIIITTIAGNKGMNRRMDRKQDRIPSLAVNADWTVIEDFDLAQLLKLQANLPKVEELKICGHIDQYDESYDKITTRTAKLLRKVENKFFAEVTTMDDPILENLAVNQVGDVFATDAILAQLMASPRSVYSWDILIEKTNGLIFLDKVGG